MMRCSWWAAAFCVIACGGSVEPQYHALFPGETSVVSQTLGQTIEVRRPSVARSLDRPELVRQAHSGSIVLSRGDHWSSPLEQLVQNVMAENLARLLPNSLVYSAGGSLTLQPDRIVEIDVREFGPTVEDVVLVAQVAVHDDDEVSAREYRMQAGRSVTTHAAQVEEMSQLIGELSVAIACTLAAPASAASARCADKEAP